VLCFSAMNFLGGLPLQHWQLLQGTSSYYNHMPNSQAMGAHMMKSSALASSSTPYLNSEMVKKEVSRAKLRAKNRIHAKTSRERKKDWLNDLKKNVDSLSDEVDEKKGEISALEKALEAQRSKCNLLENDMHAVQALFKECASANGDKVLEADGKALLEQQGSVLNKPDFDHINHHISTIRTFLKAIMTSTSVGEIMGLCCRGATFHWPSVPKYLTIQSYLQFPRELKAAYIPDLAFTQQSVTFSEDLVAVVLIFSGTHTESNGNVAMPPSTPPKRFERTVVYVFSFNNWGKIAYLSKTFDIADMYHQLGWSMKLSNENSINDPFSIDNLTCTKSPDCSDDEKEEPNIQKMKTEEN
jgi:hypothetical protein